MKTLTLTLALAGFCWADVVRFTGTVTEVIPEAAAVTGVQAGDSFEGWLGFEVFDALAGGPWMPQAVDFQCSLSGNCTSDLTAQYTVRAGGRYVRYKNGSSWGETSFGGDFLGARLGQNLTVLAAYTTGGAFVMSAGAGDLQNSFFVDGVGISNCCAGISGQIDSIVYAQIPEPSAFILAATALLGLWAYCIRLQGVSALEGSKRIE